MSTEDDPPRQVDPKHTIAYLKLKNRRLSDELKDKDKLLKRFMEVAHKQSKQISSLSAALQDTTVWDPLTCPRPSCSTPVPGNRPSWVEVVVGGNLNTSPEKTAAPGPALHNRFAALLDVEASESATAPDPVSSPDRHSSPPRNNGVVLAAGGKQAPVGLPRGHSPPPRSKGIETGETAQDGARRERVSAHTAGTSSSRRLLLRDAVRRHSAGSLRCDSAESPALTAGGSLRPNTARSSPVYANAAVLMQPSPPPALPSSVSATEGRWSPRCAATSTLPQPSPPAAVSEEPPHRSPPQPQPLFPPTALLVGDSIIRYCKFFNATTHCFPGATARTILDKLPGLLQSAPPTINKIILHVGTNDTTRRQSELTKLDFIDLFNFLAASGKTVFISSPIPTLGRGDERFSRIRSLNTWLHHISSTYNFGFIDNFNLFWCRPSFFYTDGLHINSLGTRFLTANIVYVIHSYNQY